MFLEELIEGMSDNIALVGNGIIRDKGKMIDEFDDVIRFNHFPVDTKYTIDVGKKTDYWCINKKIRHHARQTNKVDVPTIMVKNYRNKIRKKIENFLQREIIIPKTGWGDLESLARYEKLLPLGGSHGLTIGFKLILYFINAEKRITTFGFDGLQTGHYWNSKHKHSHDNGKAEYDFLVSCDLIRMVK